MLLTGLLALSAAIAWLSYRSTPHIALPLLRFASLAILAYVLTDPLLTFTKNETVKPKWLVLADDSQSMSAVSSDVLSALKALESADTSGVSLRFRSFATEVRQLTSSTYLADQVGTNLHLALAEPADVILLITDGIATTGKDPLMIAERNAVPIHVIAAGDTTRFKDIALLDADFPPNASTDSELAVPVRVVVTGYKGSAVTLRLLENGAEIESKSIQINEDEQFIAPVFNLRLKEEGLRRFEVVADGFADEKSTANNRIRASVKVESKRIRVLHAVYEIHPDIETITSVYRSDPTLDISMQRFSILNADSADVLVIHGWPSDPIQIAAINRAIQRIPALIAPLPVTFKNGPARFVAGRIFEKLILPVAQGAHPVTDLPVIAVDRMPYLFGPLPDTTRGQYELRLASSTQGFLLETSRSQRPRQAVLHAWGWYRLSQSPTAAEQEWNRTFFLNLIQWLSASESESRMDVEAFPRQLTQDTPLRFNVRLRNDSGEPQNGADVIARVLGSVYRLEASGSGFYSFAGPTLPEGFHDVEIRASVNGTEIASERRTVDTGPSQIEFRRLTRDQALLKALAERTGGTLTELGADPGVESILQMIQSMKPETKERVEKLSVARHPAWFVLLLLLLTTEWFWRRRVFLP